MVCTELVTGAFVVTWDGLAVGLFGFMQATARYRQEIAGERSRSGTWIDHRIFLDREIRANRYTGPAQGGTWYVACVADSESPSIGRI